MPTIQVKRAATEALIQATPLAYGEFGFARDNSKLYIGTNGTAAGNVILNPDIGEVDEAGKLATAQAFSISGDATAPAVNFDGTAAVNLVLTLAESGVTAGTYTKLTVDAKGRVTGGAAITVSDLPDIPVSKITGLGTAATVDTGTDEGNIPVLGADGKLAASMMPDQSGTYLTVGLKGAANGVAELDNAGKVPASQLPSYVDDVVEVANFEALPAEGETGKIYVTLDTNKTYRWGGSEYVEISASLALGTTASTAFAGDKGQAIYDSTINGKLVRENPSLTAADVGADASGAAAAVLGTSGDAATAATVYGARALAQQGIDDAAGALAAADAKVASVTKADNSITIGGTAVAPTVGVALSATTGNILELKSDGLFAEAKEYTNGNGIDITDDTISAKVVSGNGLSLTTNGITMSVATTSTPGAVKPDGTALTVDANGLLGIGNIDCGEIGSAG